MSTISSAGNSPVYRPDVSSSQQGGAAQGAKGASDAAPPDAAGSGAPSGAASSAPTQYTEAARAETPARFTQPQWGQVILPQMNPDGSPAPGVVSQASTGKTMPLFGN